MFPVSAAFLAALSQSHGVVVKAEVLTSGQVVATLAGTIQLGSNVSAIKGMGIRRHCYLKMVDATGAYIPGDANALLAPYGNELRLWRGIQFADGTSELACLGVFEITDTRVIDAAAGVTIEITGVDRADEVSRSTLTDVFTIADGTNAVTAVQTLINNARAGLTFSLPITSYNVPVLTYMPGDDPLAEAQKIAQAFGAEVFFDQTGVCVIQYEPTPATQAVVQTFAEGEVGTMTGIERLWTNRSVPSQVVREGLGSTATTLVRGVAADVNPNSPTYEFGKYGIVTDYASNNLLLTSQQCIDAATGALKLSKGKLEQVRLLAIPNPALDVGDVVSVYRAKLGIGGNYVIDSLTMPMDHTASMDLTLRRVVA